jgi:hypothetical protein
MCITVNKYQNSIIRLQQDIYPSLQDAIDTLSQNESSIENFAHTFLLMQQEFQSLKVFEEQHVFPIILSLFNESLDEKDFSPAISEIIRITSMKEGRLKVIMDQIAMAQHPEVFTLIKSKEKAVTNNVETLINIFYSRFLPAKQLWKQLLIPLQNGSAKCNNRSVGGCKCNHDSIRKTHTA